MSRSDVTSVGVHHVLHLHYGCLGRGTLPSDSLSAPATVDKTCRNGNHHYGMVCGSDSGLAHVFRIRNPHKARRQQLVQVVLRRHAIRVKFNARDHSSMCVLHHSTSKRLTIIGNYCFVFVYPGKGVNHSTPRS